MDWPVTNGIATIVAVSDGTVSIYLSSGGGFIGGGQAHESIRRAGAHALSVAKELQPKMIPTTQFPLPSPDEVIFYLIDPEGVYSATALEVDLKTGESPYRVLGGAAQEIIMQYRLKYPAPSRRVQ
jgi:hypothetical protein